MELIAVAAVIMIFARRSRRRSRSNGVVARQGDQAYLATSDDDDIGTIDIGNPKP